MRVAWEDAVLAFGKVWAGGVFVSLGLYPWLILACFLVDISVVSLMSLTLGYRTAPHWDVHEAFLKAGIFVVTPALAGAIGAYMADLAFGLKGPLPALAVGVLASATLLPFDPAQNLWPVRGCLLAGAALVVALDWRRLLPRPSGTMAPSMAVVLWVGVVLSGSVLSLVGWMIGKIGT